MDKKDEIILQEIVTPENGERFLKFFEVEKELIKAKHQKELEVIDQMIDYVKTKLDGQTIYFTKSLVSEQRFFMSNKFNTRWTWDEKIDFILKEANGKPLTSAEIIGTVAVNDPKRDKNTIKKSVSSRLSVRAKAGEIERKENEKGDFVYTVKKEKPHSVESGLEKDS